MLKRALALCAVATLAACTTPPAPPPPAPAAKPTPAIAQFEAFTYEGHDPVYDTIKAGPGDYLNPINPGFYPDPSFVRVGDDYYLVNSTFSFSPGIPVFHSRDLVHWTQIGNAIDRQLNFDKLEMSRGAFAPAINYHDGTFYILNTCVDCGGNFLITAKNPAGPWSEPVWLPFDGIDSSIFFDKDGKAYVTNNGAPEGEPRYDGHRAIWMQELDLATNKLVGPRRVIVNGGTDIKKKPVWVEGPHIYRVNGWYYLMCAEGGTADQHSEVIFRSKKVWGPYVSYKGNPILTQRDLPADRTFPITSTGHADLLQTQKGEWWAVFLGTRPYGDDLYNTGRETFLLPVTWKNGWPVILPKGKPVPYVHKRPNLPVDNTPLQSGNFTVHEDFNGSALGPQWLFIRTSHETWYTLSNGSLKLKARPEAIGGLGQPSFVGHRQQHGWASVSVSMNFAPQIDGERAGLAAFQNSNAFYFLGVVRENGKSSLCVTKRSGKDEADQGTALTCIPAPEGKLGLKIEPRGGKIDFLYSTAPGNWTALLRDADNTILSTKKAGGFVGTVIGPYAYSPQ